MLMVPLPALVWNASTSISHKAVPPLVLMTLPAPKHGACVQLVEKATPVERSASEFVGQVPPLLLPELLPLPELPPELLLPELPPLPEPLLLPLEPPLPLPLPLPLPPPDEPDPPLDPPELDVSAPLSAAPDPAEPP
jgi:hypothetical protein